MSSFMQNPNLLRLPRNSISALIFCFFFLIYALTIHGQLRYGDETERYLQAQSLVERQSFEIRRVPGHQTIAPNGKNYSQFEMGYGILLVPPYIVGKIVNSFFAYPELDWIPLLFVFLVNPLITALTCVVLFWFSRALGVDEVISFWITLLFGLATIALPYTKGLYREPLQGLALLAAACAIYLFRRDDKPRWFWISAICFGYAVFTKVANGIMLPLFWAYLWFVFVERRDAADAKLTTRRRKRTLGLFAFLLPTLVLLAIQGVVNLVKYENVFVIGPSNYRDPLPYFSLAFLPEGVTGLLLSPEKSLFLYAPPTILYLVAWVPFFRKHLWEALLSLALIVVNVLFNGAYQLWGSVNWGPRYLVLIVPFLILPVGILLQSARGWQRWLWRVLTAITLGMGLVVQAIAALTDDREFLGVLPASGNLFVAHDLFIHSALDSLVISLAAQPNRVIVNPWLWVSLALVVFAGVSIVAQFKRSDENKRMSPRAAWIISIILLLGQFGVFWISVLSDYPRVLQGKANSKYVAANNYFAEGRSVEAYNLYARALYQGTAYATESKARMEEIQPRAGGSEVELGNLGAHVMTQDIVQVTDDAAVSLSGVASLRISAPPGKAVSVEADSEFVPVVPSTQYEWSGWIKTEGMYGMGIAFVAWYEDNGKWQQSRAETIFGQSESRGWRQFHQMFTTLPTTKRILLRMGLWQTQGTLWVDDVHFVAISANTTNLPSRSQ